MEKLETFTEPVLDDSVTSDDEKVVRIEQLEADLLPDFALLMQTEYDGPGT